MILLKKSIHSTLLKMQQIPCIVFCLFILNCNSNRSNEIIANKYIEGFYNTKLLFANKGSASVDKAILPIIDSIISQTKTYKIKTDLRQAIIDELGKFSIRKTEQESLSKLKASSKQFLSGRNTFLEDLDFIDLFLGEKYSQQWNCDLGIHQTETLISFDTILLKMNHEYELPIRIEYNNFPSCISIISNSIQGSKPNTIKFKTPNSSKKYHTVTYSCEALNEVTGSLMCFEDKIVVQLVKTE